MLRATKRNPSDEWNFFLLAATYGHLGRKQEAKTALDTFNKTWSLAYAGRPLTLADVDDWRSLKYPVFRERLKEGLRKAGVQATAKLAELNYRKLVTVSEGTFDVEGVIEIDAAAAKTLHDRGIAFFDSRGSGSYNRGHIPGATNLYFHQVWDSLSEVVDKDANIVFYCGEPKCHLAANSSAQALSLGYTKVYYFAGGFSAWESAGYPVAGS